MKREREKNLLMYVSLLRVDVFTLPLKVI